MVATAYRLPTHVRPLSYHVELYADPARSDFSGTVDMLLDVQQATSTIEMHARGLVLSDALAAPVGEAHSASPSEGGRERPPLKEAHSASAGPRPARIAMQPERQAVTLTLEAPLPAGRANLRIAFSGQLSPSMHGLYLGTDGVHRAVCTQCEATDARAIFPCFDEPEFKAALRWTLHTGAGVIALANGPLVARRERSVLRDGRPEPEIEQRFEFAATLPVSSYLAAVAVGDFECGPERLVNNVPLRVYAPRGKGGQTAFAQQFTARLLPWYEHYFDYPYPFVKYDQVAVPGFDAGAMENVGLVLFRQNLLLMDPATASWRQEKLIAKVIAHEFAHMWFGNLVTMRWWDDLWLNEAFAEWMAHKATAAIEPSYEVWNDFIEDKSRALFDDALASTHPIWSPVATPDEAIEMFDSITYQKGCAVMRMLESFLGEETFRAGLRAYMKEFAGRNAQGGDLWLALQQASGQPVAALMRSWITQPGFPIIDLALRQSEGGPAQVALHQQRFFSDAKAQGTDQLWSVPLVVRFADDAGVHTHRFIGHSRHHTETLPAQGRVRFCYGNADDVGFYRVHHDDDTLAALLRHGLDQLSPVEQAGLLEDQWALVRNATIGITPFLHALRALARVRDHNVLRALIERLEMLDLIVKDAGDRAARLRLRALVAAMLSPQLDELGFVPRAGEPQNDVQRRALVITALANLARVPTVISEAERYAAVEQQEPRAIDANLAGVFVAVAAKFGDEVRYAAWVETFLRRKAKDATPQEIARYLHTLSAFRRPGLPERTLKLIEEGVIPQEAISSVLAQLLGWRHAQEAAWSYVKSRWSVLRERVGDMGLSRMVEAVGRLRAVHRDDVVGFFQQHTPAGAERALLRALERMDQAEELRQRITADLLTYLTPSATEPRP